MVGKKIRAYREFMGLNQVQLANLSGINVGTIRKYELGIRNPKPQQLEKIADALGLNISLFLDFNIETVGDVLSLLFSIDNAVDLSVSSIVSNEENNQTTNFTFKNKTLQNMIEKWCEFKSNYEKEKRKILLIEDKELQKQELAKLELSQEEWKLRSITINSNISVKKEI